MFGIENFIVLTTIMKQLPGRDLITIREVWLPNTGQYYLPLEELHLTVVGSTVGIKLFIAFINSNMSSIPYVCQKWRVPVLSGSCVHIFNKIQYLIIPWV